MNFERIIFIRESLDLSQREIADKLKVSKSNYARWETGEKTIPLNHLIDLCNLANITLDYALSLSDNRDSNHENIIIDSISIGSKLKDVREKNNLNQTELAEIINSSQSVVSDFENGTTLIQTSFLYEICNRFNVSADYILN